MRMYWPPSGVCAYSLMREVDDFGIATLDLARPPARFWSDGEALPNAVEPFVDKAHARVIASPAQILSHGPEQETWRSQSGRSVAKLMSWFLVCEDPQARLLAQDVVTLAHQASVVRHILQTQALDRVLLADEVGLGKTIEAGLILRELITQQPGLRVLYLAPARLVANVRREMERLGLQFRSWVAGAERDATLEDARVIASIHRAAYPANFEGFRNAAPWDVIVVDECHHLSAWEPEGGSPVQKYKLVEMLRAKLPPSGRLILMSGTPHQGHPDRFKNLVTLLQAKGESEEQLAGRVIYRTKDDVQDWDGHPLFPRRSVNAPVVLELDEQHQRWLQNIHRLFEPERFAFGSTGDERVAGWRAGQALQWATSSSHAGLGYLVRQAIRAGWTLGKPSLAAAVEALRPYRGGARNEPAESVFERIARDIEAHKNHGEEGGDGPNNEDEARWRPDNALLGTLLAQGVELLRVAGDRKWQLVSEAILDHVGDEKVVLFAQPIETVTALADYLMRTRSIQPAIIVGGQSEMERRKEIERFWKPSGPQFLISSRAGGEGINLQIARRLVHLDVPWNPMDMEQRVGRVHRFLSRKTVIVDTVVVGHSREVDAYRVARNKLREIAATLVAPEKFENLFARVMSLVPPEELQSLLVEQPLGPLSTDEQMRMMRMVTEGFERWSSFHEQYAEQREGIQALPAGQADWKDVAAFARRYLRATPAPGFAVLRFERQEDNVIEASVAVEALAIEGEPYCCGDYGGMPITDMSGCAAKKLGINSPMIARKLRELGLPNAPAGAAHLRWPDSHARPEGLPSQPFGVLAMVRQTIRHTDNGWRDVGSRLAMWIVKVGEEPQMLCDVDMGRVVRALVDATIRLEPGEVASLVDAVVGSEASVCAEWRRPSEEERAQRMAVAVAPVFAAVVS